MIETLVIGSLTLTSMEFELFPRFGGLLGFGALGAFGFLFLVTCHTPIYSFNFFITK
jgi:hypothetical protein